MKLVLQVAAGIVLAACVITGFVYSYHYYSHRSTADQFEWAAAREYMNTLARTCPGIGSSTECAELATKACKNFGINEPDCADLVHEAVQKLKDQKK